MSIDDFFQSAPETILSGLDPYQIRLVNELLAVSGCNYEMAADMWLNASPSQTSGFGGDKTHLKLYREKITEEIEKFLCGTDETYKAERQQLHNSSIASQQYIVGVLSTAIGSQLGIAGAFIAPAIVLIIMSFGKMSLNAWCEMRNNKKSATN